MIDLHQ